MADNIFDIEIITPDRVFYKGETDFLEFNTQNGEIGVYKNHIPLTTVLAPGIVTIHNGDEQSIQALRKYLETRSHFSQSLQSGLMR